jgi:hypothetical protein
MSQDEFTKLFKYIERRFNQVDQRFDKVDEEIGDLKLAVGELAGQIKDYHQEMVMLARKVDRMERWIHEIAKQTGIKLSAP